MKTEYERVRENSPYEGLPHANFYYKSDMVVLLAQKAGYPSIGHYESLHRICEALSETSDRFGLAISGFKALAKLTYLKVKAEKNSAQRHQFATEGLEFIKRALKLTEQVERPVPSLLKYEVIFLTIMFDASRELGDHIRGSQEQGLALKLGNEACRKFPTYAALHLAYLNTHQISLLWKSHQLMANSQRVLGLCVSSNQASNDNQLEATARSISMVSKQTYDLLIGGIQQRSINL